MNGNHESLMCEDVRIANPIIGIETKKCTKCGIIKSVEKFEKLRFGYDWYRGECRKCRTEKELKSRKDHYISKPKKGEHRKCAYCDKEVYISPWKRKFKNSFCCGEHYAKFLKESSFSKKCGICGEVFHCQPCQIHYRNRRTCSVKCRSIDHTQKAKEKRIKKGLTDGQIRRLIRVSEEYKAWRKGVFERDDYTCYYCGERGGYIEAHHIKNFAEYPSFRFDISNGTTLCRKCHDKTKQGSPAKV